MIRLVTAVALTVIISCSVVRYPQLRDSDFTGFQPIAKAIVEVLNKDWAQVSGAEFKILQETALNPVLKELFSSLLRSIPLSGNPNPAWGSPSHYIISESDDPLLFQLMERHFVQMTERTLAVGDVYFLELFTISIAYCMNGAISGAESCLRDFDTASLSHDRFHLGNETKFVLMDDTTSQSDNVPMETRVRMWLRSMVKESQDSIMGIRIIRTHGWFNKADLKLNKVSFDHPVAVYMHFPK